MRKVQQRLWQSFRYENLHFLVKCREEGFWILNRVREISNLKKSEKKWKKTETFLYCELQNYFFVNFRPFLLGDAKYEFSKTRDPFSRFWKLVFSSFRVPNLKVIDYKYEFILNFHKNITKASMSEVLSTSASSNSTHRCNLRPIYQNDDLYCFHDIANYMGWWEIKEKVSYPKQCVTQSIRNLPYL